MFRSHFCNATLVFFLVGSSCQVPAQAPVQVPPRAQAPNAGATLMDQGTQGYETPEFRLRLVRSSQTIAALKPNGGAGFDFTPGDLLAERQRDGFYHLGDLDLRVRRGKEGPWLNCSTARNRRPVTVLPAAEPVLAAADLGPTLPKDCPLHVTRTWLLEGEHLVLRFTLANPTSGPVQVGALGIPMVFNNVIEGRDLDEAHAMCSFTDPYLGGDAGYVQVTRLNGHGPALLVVPDGNTPLEGWNPLLNARRHPKAGEDPAGDFTDGTPRGQAFEGFCEWMVHTTAYADNEWSKAKPWNPATMLTLNPGESRTYGVKFLVAPDIRSIEGTLAAAGRPVAVGIPGYVLPMGMEAKLMLRYGQAVKAIQVEPAGAVTLAEGRAARNGWKSYTMQGRSWGRARIAITYQDGLVQAVHCFVTKPEAQAVADLGHFLTTRQWFVDPKDPFGRSPSVMTFDRDENRIVTQDSRVWVAGLGDEGGSSWLTGALKLLGQPDAGQVKQYEAFVDQVLWGGLQYKEGPQKYAVRKSLFYYQPDQLPPGTYRSDLDWTSWTSWNRQATEAVDRSYDYPHVAALHWAMYRLARNHVGLVTNHPWQWYLANAYETGMAMAKFAPYYTRFGQMEGTVFLRILEDLQREGMAKEAEALEGLMRSRTAEWKTLPYPFGSEMAWDSTGQEEVYAWTRYFGDDDKAKVCIDAILGYMPTVPHWGYSGNARRYWDFLYGGKITRIERQLHHYGSGLNAIPLLTQFRDHPDDFHLLRVGYSGMLGALASIDQEGFASAAFHSFPDTLRFDPISGDYAQNFFGHAINTATYVVDHPDFGWQAFGGNLEEKRGLIRVTPLDSFRNRVYLASLGLWLTLDAGRFKTVELDPLTRKVRLELDPASPDTPTALLRLEQPAKREGVGKYKPVKALGLDHGGFKVPLAGSATWVELGDS